MSSIRTISKHNHEKAWNYFVSIGQIPANAEKWKFVLHHKDPSLKKTDPYRYHEWRVEDLEVMLHSDHTRLHKPRSGISGTYIHSEDTKKKISESMKGNQNTLGFHHTAESKYKMSIANRGSKWFNNGLINVRRHECPEGFVPGILKR